MRALGGFVESQPLLLRVVPKAGPGRAPCQLEEVGLYHEVFIDRREETSLHLGSDPVRLHFRKTFQVQCGKEMRRSLGKGGSRVSETN